MGNNKLGYDQIQKVLVLILALGNSVSYIANHPELGVTRFAKLTECFDELMAMGTFDAAQLKLEFLDLDSVEKEQLAKLVKEKFDIENEKLETKIEEGLDLFAEGYEFLSKVGSFVKAMKA